MDDLLYLVLGTGRHSLEWRINELDERFRDDPTKVDVHGIEGLCASFELVWMLSFVHAFKSSPSDVILLNMRSLLSQKRRELLLGEAV
jgi:hypothetical protein